MRTLARRLLLGTLGVLALSALPEGADASEGRTNECRPNLGAHREAGTLRFYGSVDCRDPARLEGDTELFSPEGRSQARGNRFQVEGTSGQSSGRLFPVSEGSEYRLVFRLKVTSLDGRSWDAEPAGDCRVDGPELSCEFSRTVKA